MLNLGQLFFSLPFYTPVYHYYYVTYFCENNNENKYGWDNNITFPDSVIYCGIHTFVIPNIEELNKLSQHIKNMNILPTIILYCNNIYIIGKNTSKCKEIEDVLKGRIMIENNDDEKNYLSTDEICYLTNWDSEKYRQICNT